MSGDSSQPSQIGAQAPGRPSVSLIAITELSDRGDMRGSSFSLPGALLGALSSAKDAHIASILPGHVRGDHYHKEKHEHLVVLSGSPWALFWDEGECTPVQQRRFEGDKVVVVGIRPGAAHAMLNIGTRELYFVGLSDCAYSELSPDAHARKVTPDQGP